MDTSMLKRKMEEYDRKRRIEEEKEKKKICKLLVDAIADEEQAYSDYRKLAGYLDELLNKYELSITLDMIAEEEKNHKMALRKVYDLLKCSVVV